MSRLEPAAELPDTIRDKAVEWGRWNPAGMRCSGPGGGQTSWASGAVWLNGGPVITYQAIWCSTCGALTLYQIIPGGRGRMDQIDAYPPTVPALPPVPIAEVA